MALESYKSDEEVLHGLFDGVTRQMVGSYLIIYPDLCSPSAHMLTGRGKREE